MKALNFKYLFGLLTIFLTVLSAWYNVAVACLEPNDSNYTSSELNLIKSKMGLTLDQANRLYTVSGYPGNISCAYQWLLNQQNQIESALINMTATTVPTVSALFTPLFTVAGIDDPTTCGVTTYSPHSLALTICNNYIIFKNKFAVILSQ